jgi:hypothetical protein
LYKLQKYGIVGSLHAWLTEFLGNRSFNVLVNSCMSKSFNVTSSVPQGSKLAPLLYILFTNDISDIFKVAKIKMYADDLTIFAVINNDDDKIAFQNDLDNLCKWCSIWGLTINYTKCKLMHMGYRNNKYSYKLGDIILKVSTCERILGVMIDDKLTFTEHIYSCIKKASNICNMILSNMYDVNNDILIRLYKVYARPYLEYATVIYSPHTLYLIDSIENVQKNFSKRLHGMSLFSYKERMHLLSLESLELRRIYTDLITVYKLLHGKISCDVKLSYVQNSMYETRGHTYKLVKNRCRLDITKFFFTFRVTNIWNCLDNNIVCAQNVQQFVNKLKLFDLSKCIRGRTLI